MRGFFAIVKLTLQESVRSNVFKLLLFFLLLAALLIPWSVGSAEGDAAGYVQVALLYSLQSISWILALSSLWLGASVMTRDVESYRLHMTISKPVSRWTVYCGKFAAVSLLNVVLLFIASAAVYFGVTYQFRHRKFSERERAKVNSEVLVGRRVFMPEREDIGKLTAARYNEKIERLRREGGGRADTVDHGKLYEEVRKEVIADMAKLKAGDARTFVFDGIPPELDSPLYLRFRPYIDEVGGNKQRITYGAWQIGIPREVVRAAAKNVFEASRAEGEGAGEDFQIYLYPLGDGVQTMQGGEFHELVLSPEWKMVTKDGKVHLLYMNLDAREGTQFFQLDDGPKLLMKVSSFAGNFLRGTLVSALLIMMMAALGCAAAAYFSMPTAIFLIVSYLIFGGFATYLVDTTYFGTAGDYVGYYVGKALLLVIIPVQDFDVSTPLSNGELIEWAVIGKIFLYYFILRTLPWFLLGGFLYRRREMGLVNRR